jgi:hypothetical protein
MTRAEADRLAAMAKRLDALEEQMRMTAKDMTEFVQVLKAQAGDSRDHTAVLAQLTGVIERLVSSHHQHRETPTNVRHLHLVRE